MVNMNLCCNGQGLATAVLEREHTVMHVGLTVSLVLRYQRYNMPTLPTILHTYVTNDTTYLVLGVIRRVCDASGTSIRLSHFLQ